MEATQVRINRGDLDRLKVVKFILEHNRIEPDGVYMPNLLHRATDALIDELNRNPEFKAQYDRMVANE